MSGEASGAHGAAHESISGWLSGLRAGDAEAVQALWDAYYLRMVRLARRRLGNFPKRAADEEDVALTAFRSFCRRAEQGRFPDLADRSDLWRVLLSLTVRKAIDLQRYELRQRRGGGRVRGRSGIAGELGPAEFDAVVGRAPTPEFAVAVAEQLQQLLLLLPEDLRQLAVAKCEGYTNGELAERFACVRRTIERRLNLIRRIWSDAGYDAGAGAGTPAS